MVNRVDFPTTIGGDGSTVTDDDSTVTGLANGGHRKRLVPMFSQMVTICQFVLNLMVGYVAQAAAFAATAVNAPGTSSTSTSSNAIPTVGTDVSFTTQTGKAWSVGQWVIAAVNTATDNNIVGQIKSYNSSTGAIVITARIVGGSGTFNAWTISVTAAQDSTLTGRVTAIETENTRLVARRRLLYKEIT